MSNNQNARTYGIAVTILLLLAAALGFVFWQKSKSYRLENERIEAEKNNLQRQKDELTASLDSLHAAYSDVRIENENLQGRLSSSAEIIQKNEIVIKQIRAQSSRELGELRKQVEDLKRIQTEYETIISVLRKENDDLRAENTRLTQENTQLKGEREELSGQVSTLAKQLEEQIRKTQSASFRATSFRVELERRGDKLTTKARRLREINVSFDLADVPANFQGPEKLYLVITDEKGNPIKADNPIKATVYAPTGPVEIMALQSKSVVIQQTQRFSFTYKLDDRVKAGNYVVAIYCDKGLLGASSFRVS
ncbi:MAG: hypothetical protein ACK4NS_09755 [Saprospiraceae bacterium]